MHGQLTVVCVTGLVSSQRFGRSQRIICLNSLCVIMPTVSLTVKDGWLYAVEEPWMQAAADWCFEIKVTTIHGKQKGQVS